MRLKAGNALGYRGRVISISCMAAVLLYIRGIVEKDFGRVPELFPFPAIIPLLLAWYLGKHYDKYVYLSTRDVLTGLYNRRYISEQFPKLRTYADRKKVNIAILLLDVNDFKEVNDHYGHEYGDRVLETLSKLLNDSFDNKDMIARWGGDEFLVLSLFSDETILNNKINHFKDQMKRENWPHKGDLSVSIGEASYPLDADHLKELIVKADSSMYKVKMNYKQMRAVKSEESIQH